MSILDKPEVAAVGVRLTKDRVYWPDLNDGLEVRHLLDPQPL